MKKQVKTSLFRNSLAAAQQEKLWICFEVQVIYNLKILIFKQKMAKSTAEILCLLMISFIDGFLFDI